jgi:proline iminopeptidase
MSSDYMASLEQLADDGMAVVTYDQRGTGRSSNPAPDAANYDLLKYVADLDAVREAVGAARVHLFGHSWGGIVAQRYATAHPDRVKSIILMGSGAPTMEATLAANDNKAQRLADLQAQGLVSDSITSVSDILPAYFSDPNFEMPPELHTLHYSPTAEQLTWTALGAFDFSQEVAKIHQLVLLLWGKDDPFGRGMVEAVESALSNADVKLVELENCGHFWHECPEAFFSELRAFLELSAAP